MDIRSIVGCIGVAVLVSAGLALSPFCRRIKEDERRASELNHLLADYKRHWLKVSEYADAHSGFLPSLEAYEKMRSDNSTTPAVRLNPLVAGKKIDPIREDCVLLFSGGVGSADIRPIEVRPRVWLFVNIGGSVKLLSSKTGLAEFKNMCKP